MRKIFTFLVAFLATLSGAVWGTDYDLSTMSEGSTLQISSGNHTITGSNRVRVSISGDVTITLDNVYMHWYRHAFEAGIRARVFDIDNGANVTLILKGQNKIEGVPGALGNPWGTPEAIYVPVGSTLTIQDSQEGGRLEAIGSVGIGTGSSEGCGTINIEGGIITALGEKVSVGGFYNSWPNYSGTVTGDVKIQGESAVLYAPNGIQAKVPEVNQGVLFSGTTQGTVYGDVVFKSNWDLSGKSLVVNTSNKNASLRLAPGVTIDNADVITGDGPVYAYDVTYFPNPFSSDETPIEVPSDNKLYGPSTSFVLPSNLPECSKHHKNLGWIVKDENIIQNGETTFTTSDSQISTSRARIDLLAVWVETQIPITIPVNQIMENRVLGVKPENAAVTITQKEGNLPQGLDYDQETHTITGTPTLEENQVVVFTVVPKDQTEPSYDIRVTFHITATTDTNLGHATVTVPQTEIYYNGQDRKALIEVKMGDVPLKEGIHYTLQRDYSASGNQQNSGNEIKHVGTYSNFVVTGRPEMGYSGTQTISNKELKISPRELTFKVIDAECEIGAQSLPEFLLSSEISGVITGETPKYNAELKLSDGSSSVPSKVGVYDIVKADQFTLEDNNAFLKDNYTVNVNSGKLTVYQNLNSVQDLTATVVKGWTYDGKSHSEGLVTEVKINNDLLNEEYYNVRYHKDGTEEGISSILDAGTYYIYIRGNDEGDKLYRGYKKVEGESIIVSQKELSVSAANQTINLGEKINSSPIVGETVVAETGIDGETAVFSGEIELAQGIDAGTVGTKREAFSLAKLLLTNSTEETNHFNSSNYSLKHDTPSGVLTVKEAKVEPEYPEETELDSEGNIIYNGKPHAFTNLKVGDKNYSISDGTISNITYTKNGQAFDNADSEKWEVGSYIATVQLKDNGYITVRMNVVPRPLTVIVKAQTITLGDDAKKDPTLTVVYGQESGDNVEVEGIIGEETISFAEDAAFVLSTNAQDAIIGKVAGTVTNAFEQGDNLKLDATVTNYTIGTFKSATLTIKRQLNPGDGGDEIEYVYAGVESGNPVYNGSAHTISAIKVTNGEETKEVAVKTATYSPQDGEGSEAVNAGTYNVTITALASMDLFELPEAGIETSMTVDKRSIEVKLRIFTAADLKKTEITAADVESFGDIVDGESLNVSGKVEFKEKEGAEGKTTYTAKFSDLTIANGTGLASNYTATFKYGDQTITDGNDEVEVPIEEVKDVTLPEDEGWGENNTRIYDGQSHNITKVMVGDIETEITGVTYSYKTSAEDDEPETVTEVKNAGIYEATITVSGKVAHLTLMITPKELAITIKDQHVKTDGSITTEVNDETVTVKTGIKDETVTVSGTLKCTTTIEAGTFYEGVIVVDGTLSMNPDNKNYTIPTTIQGGDLYVKATVPVDPVEDPSQLDGIRLGDGWASHHIIYNGQQAHKLEHILIHLEGEATDEWHEINVTTTYETGTAPVNAGQYIATVTVLKDNDWIEAGSFKVKLWIDKRPMHMDFKLPSTIESTDPIDITVDHLKPETQSNDPERGLLKNEAPLVVKSGQFIFGEPNVQGECSVSIRNFTLDNTDKFTASNYQLQVWNPETRQYEDYDPNDGDITIIDPENPDNNPNNPGEGGGIVVNPDDDDDDDDWTGGDHINYYNIYDETECEGVELTFSRNVVKEGQSVLVEVETKEGYDTTNMKLWFKRGMYGYWEELKLDKNDEYRIKNIWTDIYVKAEGVATGIEDVYGDNPRVYTKDGSIYVYTPQQEEVAIIAMTGAVVKRDKQVGLQQYKNLNVGIYVVRVGEQVFKVRVK